MIAMMRLILCRIQRHRLIELPPNLQRDRDPPTVAIRFEHPTIPPSQKQSWLALNFLLGA
ncbi:hypothetical protein RBSWK_01274 [Rhodopirellula baltica SWK14]|uniref:Uncharacterized protein n=1 Tax=Rhodopirellula baltica SWK14 TaxID=993516 RepID=L7CMA7_RHOBT|nr:hypothetical protein RBSWK_01274 [Rhodopirellula baltica SWK14]